MQVKSYKLPPLPNKRQAVVNNQQPNKVVLPGPRVISFSRDKNRGQKSQQKQLSTDKNIRPLSARQRSIDSVKSNCSAQSRDSVKSRDSKHSKSSHQEKEESELYRRLSIQHNVKARVAMPTISAKSWAVYEMNQERFIYGKRIFKKRQIASITKAMNLITILQLLEKLGLDASQIKIAVSKDASLLIGTTAELKPGMELSVQQLFYGMMLPSGNDAAFQLAEVGGALLQMEKSLGIDKKMVYDMDEFTKYYSSRQGPVKTYLTEMNKVCRKIHMKNSNFANPHGLSNMENYSCAEDLCRLCTYAMKNPKFRGVVNTKVYSVNCRNKITNEENQQQWSSLRWQNTNKMLKQGWSGIKTGVTPNAGPCLAASVKKHFIGRDCEFLVILICSKSMEARWTEVKEIVDWIISEDICF